MDVVQRFGVVTLSSAGLMLAACGGGARRQTWPAAGPTPAAVKPMLVPPNPYSIIYTAPVSLAKPPDTTAHAPARKPRS